MKGEDTLENYNGDSSHYYEGEHFMIEGLSNAIREISKKVESFKEYLPSFNEKLESNAKSFEDADKPLSGEAKEVYERKKINELSQYSQEINDCIGSVEELNVYIEAELTEVEIDGEKCLIRNDIDFEQKDSMGRTNTERIDQGLSPINKEGKVIELHHIGQKADSPLAELTQQEHRGKGNDTILHDKTKESEIDRGKFASERNDYWEARVKSEGGNS